MGHRLLVDRLHEIEWVELRLSRFFDLESLPEKDYAELFEMFGKVQRLLTQEGFSQQWEMSIQYMEELLKLDLKAFSEKLAAADACFELPLGWPLESELSQDLYVKFKTKQALGRIGVVKEASRRAVLARFVDQAYRALAEAARCAQASWYPPNFGLPRGPKCQRLLDRASSVAMVTVQAQLLVALSQRAQEAGLGGSVLPPRRTEEFLKLVSSILK